MNSPELRGVRSSQRFLSLDDLTHLPKPTWLIENLMEVNSLVMLAGPPASYKSFLCLDWLLCLASGREWLGRKITPSKVLYVLGEGKSSLLKRANCWAHHNKPTREEMERLRDNFKTTFEVPQLAARSSVDTMLAQLSEEGYAPNVIAIDTFARSFVGLDENSQQDTGLWVESADRLRNLGYTVIFLHHTKKNAEFGLQYRGSTAIMGAMDTAMTMNAEKSRNLVTLSVTKQKDHDEGDPLRFNRLIVRPDGDTEGSVVLVPAPPKMDERFDPLETHRETRLKTVMTDETFKSDWDRARHLAETLDFQGVSVEALQKRISRRRQDETRSP